MYESGSGLSCYGDAASIHNFISSLTGPNNKGGKRDLMYHNGPLSLLIFSRGNCGSLKDVLSSSVDPLRPLLIYVLIVSAVAVTTEGLR